MVASPLNSTSFPPVENLSDRNSSSAAAAAHYGEALKTRRKDGGKREEGMHAEVHNMLPRRLVLSISAPPLPDHGGAASRNARRGYRIKIVPVAGWKTQDDSYDSGVTHLPPRHWLVRGIRGPLTTLSRPGPAPRRLMAKTSVFRGGCKSSGSCCLL